MRELGGAPLAFERLLREWFCRVGETLVQGAESWYMIKQLYEHVETWQNHRLREFLRLRRRQGQSYEEWMTKKNCTPFLRVSLDRHDLRSLGSRMLKKVQFLPWRAWAMPAVGGDRRLWRAIEWRPWEEWGATQAALSSRDRFNSLGWRHASRAPEESFERALVLVYGAAWRTSLQTLQGRQAWRSTARSFAPQWQRLSGVRVQQKKRGRRRAPA